MKWAREPRKNITIMLIQVNNAWSIRLLYSTMNTTHDIMIIEITFLKCRDL